MIVESIFNLLFLPIEILLAPLTVINFVVDSSIFAPILSFLNMATYLIPIKSLMPIIIFSASLMGFRIIISLIKTIWQLLPIT